MNTSLAYSPKKKVSYRVNYFDDSNSVAQKLKQNLHSIANVEKTNEQKETLFHCLNEMLKTVAITNDKSL